MKSRNHDTLRRSKSRRAVVVVDHKSNSNDTNNSSATFPTLPQGPEAESEGSPPTAVPATTTESSWITTTTTTPSSTTAAGWLPSPATVPPDAPPFAVNNSNSSNSSNCGNQPQPHAAASGVVLEVAVVLVWLVAVLCAAYYIQTEHQHRRRRLRRQRQERLEEFSPRQQAHRKLLLQQLFQVQSTILHVQSTDFRRVHNTNNTTKTNNQDLSLENRGDHGQDNQTTKDHSTKIDNHDGNGERLDNDTSISHVNITVNDGDEEGNRGESQQLCHGKEFGQKAITPVSSSSPQERTTLDHGVWEGGEEEHANHGNHPNEENRHEDDDNDDSHDNDEEDEEEQWTLQLPTGRWIPATCIICLKRYQPGDWVAWSPNYDRQDDDGRTNGHTNHNSHHTNTNCNNNAAGCPHAFHQQCVIEWLAKLPNCNCPVCRKPFCHLSSLQQHNKTITKDIANNNDTDTAKQDQDQDKQERKGGEILSKPLLHFTV